MHQDRSGSGDIDRTLSLLWGDEIAGSARGARRTLTVAQIVEAAVEIADTADLDAVSMRSVATALGVGTMSLYRYIPGKAELLDLMLDRVSRPEVEELPADWRDAMETVARELWRLHLTHRWLPFVDQTRPLLGPNALYSLDLVMGALRGIGLDDQEKTKLMVTIDSFVTSLARTANAAVKAEERTGMTDDEFWKAQGAALESAMESGRYPHMAALADDSFAMSQDEIFEFGLRCILDGVAALLEERDG